MTAIEVEAGDVVRLILQFLKENGLHRTAQVLQDESQCTMNALDNVEQFAQDIRNGNWDAVLQTTVVLKLPEDKMIDLYEQIIVELAELRETETARALLRQTEPMEALKKLQPDRYMRMERLLQRTFFDPVEAYPPGTSKDGRREGLAETLSAEVRQVPPSRLMALIGQALKWQQHTGELPAGEALDLFRGGAAKKTVEAEAIPRKQVKTIKFGKKSLAMCARFSPDGDYLATGSQDGFIEIWDPETGKLCKDLVYQERDELLMHDDAVLCVAFDAEGELLASGDSEGRIRVWRVRTGKCVKRFDSAHSKGVTDMCFSPDGSQLLSASMDQTCRVHGLKSGKILHEYRGHASFVNSCAYHGRHAHVVVTGSSDGTVKLWDARTAHCQLTFRPPQNSATQDVAITAVFPLLENPELLAVCSRTQSVHIMTPQGQLVRTLTADTPLSKAGFTRCVLSPKGKFIHCAMEDGRLVSFNMEDGLQEGNSKIHDTDVVCMAHHPHKNMLVTVAAEQHVRIWAP